MAVNGSDYFMISRAGANYKVLGSDILAYMEANMGTSQFDVPTIVARNALANLSVGDRVYVVDATGDATVATGWAIYIWRGAAFTKVAEQESMDVLAGSITNLTWTPGPTSGIVVSSDGADAIIPAVNATEAGLMLPAHKAKVDFLTATAAFNADTVGTKVGFITVTAATDLDAMRAASHAAVTTGGAANNNPIVATGQVLTFSIANLTTAP